VKKLTFSEGFGDIKIQIRIARLNFHRKQNELHLEIEQRVNREKTTDLANFDLDKRLSK